MKRLTAEIAKARASGASIVFTNGCFDLLHLGHLRSLEEASGLGDQLVVAVNSDASVRANKGQGRPIVAEGERRELVAGLDCVDWVVGFDAPTPLALIERIRPDVLAKGGDWTADSIVGRDVVEAEGGRVVRLRRVVDKSTTDRIAEVVAKQARRKR